MTQSGGDSDFSHDWEEVRAQAEIQFTPVELPETPQPPGWWERFNDWLSELLAPLAEFLVRIWPVLYWVLIALAAVIILYAIVRLVAPDLVRLRKRRPAETDWTPTEQEALALLEDADALAAQGRYEEATHLLLQRSVGQIAEIRPDLIEPSSTAREIAGLAALPEQARNAFATISERVERSLFALRRLSAEDWQAARSAYADFALGFRGVDR